MEILGPILALAVVAAVIAWSVHAAAKRRELLAGFAAAEGLEFRPDRIRELDDRHPGFGCLRRGRSRYAHNRLRGTLAGVAMTGFDYHYVTGHGKNRRTHRFSAVIVDSPWPLRALLIRRENVLDRIGEFIGLDDIDFESAEFSRRFFVKATDRRWAYGVVHPRMMEYLLEAPDFSLQLDADALIAWRDRRFEPEDFRRACELARGFFDRMPDYLVRDLEGGASRGAPDEGNET